MYGSQTGVAESIAKGLHEKIVLANTSGSLETVIVECNRYKRTGLKNVNILRKTGRHRMLDHRQR